MEYCWRKISTALHILQSWFMTRGSRKVDNSCTRPCKIIKNKLMKLVKKNVVHTFAKAMMGKSVLKQSNDGFQSNDG